MLTSWHLHWNVSPLHCRGITGCLWHKVSETRQTWSKWRCDWCAFHKPMKSIHWVSWETNSPTSFGVSSSSVYLSKHSSSWHSNCSVEKESSIQINIKQLTLWDKTQREVKCICLCYFSWNSGFKHSLLLENSSSPGLPGLPYTKPSLRQLGILKSHSECLAANKQIKQHITE